MLCKLYKKRFYKWQNFGITSGDKNMRMLFSAKFCFGHTQNVVSRYKNGPSKLQCRTKCNSCTESKSGKVFILRV